MRRRLIFKLILVLFLVIFARCSRARDPIEALSEVDPVYVILDPSSMDSLNSKLSPSLSNYGDVSADDFVPRYKFASIMQNGGENLAVMIYTDSKTIPADEMYMPMHLRDIFELVVSGKIGVNAISVNRDAVGEKDYSLSETQIKSAIGKLAVVTPLPLSVYVTK